MLLDTNALITLAEGRIGRRTALRQIEETAREEGIFVSPVSAWEIGLLAAKQRWTFDPDPKRYFAAFLARPGVNLAPFTPEIAIEASFLPGSFHQDPGDRLLVATARHLGVPIATSDYAIIRYGKVGHVRVLAC